MGAANRNLHVMG